MQNCNNKYKPESVIAFQLYIVLITEVNSGVGHAALRIPRASPTRADVLECTGMIQSARERRTLVSSYSISLTLNKTRDLFSIESIALAKKYYYISFVLNYA